MGSDNWENIQLFLNTYFQEEPGANGTEIMNGLRYVRPGNGFVPAFPLSSKTEVNGLQEHKMFTYLKVNITYIPFTSSVFFFIILFLLGAMMIILIQFAMHIFLNSLFFYNLGTT